MSSKMNGRRYEMHEAIYSGNINLLIDSIKCGGDVNERNYIEYTPIFSAIEKNDIRIVKILIDAGARLDVVGGIGNRSPLQLAEGMAKDDKEYFDTNIITLIKNTLNSYQRY